MKKIKLTYLCALVIIIFSGFLLSGYGEEMYQGIEFDNTMFPYLFTALSFICFTIVEKNTPLSFFSDCNLARLVRVHSRRKALFYDIARIYLTVFVLQGCESLAVLAGSCIYRRKIYLAVLLQYFFMNYIIKLLMILIQYFLELSAAYNFAFLGVFLVFAASLFGGSRLHEKIMETSDMDKQRLYIFLNKCDLINYTSISRTEELVGSILIPAIFIIIVILCVCAALFVYIKKADLLRKEV